MILIYDQNHVGGSGCICNASFPKQVAGSHSIRVFSDGGYTLHARKNFHVEKAKKRQARLNGTISTRGQTRNDNSIWRLCTAYVDSCGHQDGTGRGSLVRNDIQVDHASTNIEVLSFNHNHQYVSSTILHQETMHGLVFIQSMPKTANMMIDGGG